MWTVQNGSNLSKNFINSLTCYVLFCSALCTWQHNGHLVRMKDLPTHCLTAWTIVWRTYQQLSLTRVHFVATESLRTVNSATAAKILCHKYVSDYIGFLLKQIGNVNNLINRWVSLRHEHYIAITFFFLYDALQPILAPKLQTDLVYGFITKI
jgi:hypothetical protein